MVKTNLRFVVSVARNYLHQGMSLPDLINEGNVGLIKAARRFDERKNFRFISYAVWWIRQGILQALADQSRIMRVPVNRVATIHRVGKTHSALEQRLRRTPNVTEVAAELGIDVNEVLHSMGAGGRHSSLDIPIGIDGNGRLVDMIEDDDGERPDWFLQDGEHDMSVDYLLKHLNGRERQVIRLYFGIEADMSYTLDEIAAQFRITRERVRQIKESAMFKLTGARERCEMVGVGGGGTKTLREETNDIY